MRKDLKALLRRLAASIVPDGLKESLFRKSFSIMSEQTQDRQILNYHMASMSWSLRNIRKLGFRPSNILDVGAYHGEWTRLVKDIFPESNVLMIEAQASKEQYLEIVRSLYPNSVSYEIALLGSEKRAAAEFYEMESGSSVLYEQSNIERKLTTVPMHTLDSLLSETSWNRSDLIKMDVQGYELEVFAGGQQTLTHAEVIVMEVSLLRVIKGAPLMHEVVRYMKEHGFLAYDICSFIRRPLDNALCQTDMIFVRETSPLLANQQYGL